MHVPEYKDLSSYPAQRQQEQDGKVKRSIMYWKPIETDCKIYTLKKGYRNIMSESRQSNIFPARKS
jgi:hypothetical protein